MINAPVIIAVPFISALIGWFTNFLAVKMIFRPRKPLRIFGLELVGLIPKRKIELAHTIGQTVEKELISHQDLHAVVSGKKFHGEILDVIITRIEEFIYTNLGSSPIVALALSGETASRIRMFVRRELERELPHVIEELFQKVESHLDFKEIVTNKIQAFDLSRLETIVYSIAARELRAIEIFGAILGFAVGVAQVVILFLLSPR